MKKEINDGEEMWQGVTDEDFYNEIGIEDVDFPIFDTERMRIFYANTNYFRQLIHLSDSLIPVERRILYTMYLLKLFDAKDGRGRKVAKSQKIVGDTSSFHPHSGDSIYMTQVNMGRSWRMAIPLVKKKGNYGDIWGEAPSSMRYTEGSISDYAYECFFSDFDDECVEMIYNEGAKDYEPFSLPSKFPNSVINGGFGIGTAGNIVCIPSYNVKEVRELTQALIKNPDYADIYIVPDLPTGADIVDNGELRSINDSGKGKLILRATIDISDDICESGSRKKHAWGLHIRNLPWMVDGITIAKEIANLISSKKLSVIDVQDDHKLYRDGNATRKEINFVVYIDKAHDPYAVRDLLWKETHLQRSVHIDFKVVFNDYTIGEMNIRDLLLGWIDERRSYKRQYYNKKLSDLSSRMDFLEILIEITVPEKARKVIEIINSSHSSNAKSRLMELANMSSHQASEILNMRTRQFTTDARENYIKEYEKGKELLKKYRGYVTSEKKLDKLIYDELEDLKKYESPRRTNVVENTGRIVPNTMHDIVVTKNGYVKKFLHREGKSPYIGALKNGDNVARLLTINNLDQILFFDNLGRVSSIPVNDIPSTDTTQFGTQVYDLTKLNGEIIAVKPYFSRDSERYIEDKLNTSMYLITLSADGYFKKMDLSEFREIKSFKNIRIAKLKDTDKLVYVDFLLDSVDVLIYTRQGMCINIAAKDIPVCSKDSQGLLATKLNPDDRCIGLVESGTRLYLFVLTEKGCVKKIEQQFMISGGKRRDTMIPIANLEQGDSLLKIIGFNEYVEIVTKSDTYTYKYDEIPTLGTRARCKKLVPVALGNVILSVVGC